MIVCYFTNWAWYRTGIAKFMPDNINASLCTHINYAFASLNSSTYTIVTSDSWADIDNSFYEQVVAYKEKGVKVMLSGGGYTNSAAAVGWSEMFRNDTKRANFISKLKEFLEKYGFDGFDCDYEYAACPQGDETLGLPTDKKYFNKLISEMKTAFNGSLLLSVAVPAGENLIKNCYDMAELCQIPDWINIMAYDYHSYSEGVIGANAPICGTNSTWGCCKSVSHFRNELNCPAEKLVLGVPFYGQTYNSSCPKFGKTASGAGDAGPYTASAGTLAYYEICLNQNNGWQSGWSKINDSYSWNNTQFVSYDDKIDLKRKSCLIKYFDLAGAMFWTLDYDDFANRCGHGIYPLLTYLNQELRCYNVSCPKCE